MVLSPFIFTFYTSDFMHNTVNCDLQKFSNDKATVGCVSKEYRGGSSMTPLTGVNATVCI